MTCVLSSWNYDAKLGETTFLVMEAILANPIFWIVVAAASEVIGLNPKWKANSVVQLIFQVLGLVKGKKG